MDEFRIWVVPRPLNKGKRVGQKARMTHVAGFERDQLLLLPEAVDDYVDGDNTVRLIDAFVDGLDLAAAGFSWVVARATGRPDYAPGDLLNLYIYGYLNRVRSSRRLERESHRNIWLLRGLKPDFKTIANFRRDNRAMFRAVFRQLPVGRFNDLSPRALVTRLPRRRSAAPAWPSASSISRRNHATPTPQLW